MVSNQDHLTLNELVLCEATPSEGSYLVIDALDIHRVIAKQYPEWELRHLGSVQTIIEVKKTSSSLPRLIFVVFVWLILFIGSGLTIMNFHTDVSMKEVHQRIYYLITGKEEQQPLILQIPYSLGIGAGMVLFFNHLFKKKFSEEPSPMDLEIFLYQETIDQYVIDHERNKES